MVVLALFIAAGCSTKKTAAERIRTLGVERFASATLSLANGHTEGNVTPERWPEEVKELQPERVRVTSSGVYVCLRSRFVTEEGVFVPTLGALPPGGLNTDPSFELLQGSIYWYNIKG